MAVTELNDSAEAASDARAEGAKRPGGRPSMADVAQLAGCSQSTVSIILNNTPGIKIGDATRERVLKAANTLGYRIPERRGPAAVGARPIAFVVDRLATSIEAIWSVEGAREAMWPSGQILLVAQTLNDPGLEARTLEHLLGQNVDA